ncbi:tuberin-like isoform X2 [Antedon mediterranea]|uniref:tuberin-like isoform X2 n=1 Tax=Antedon mediterranea TaxID=105859 RepID=UPI003AFA00D1
MSYVSKNGSMAKQPKDGGFRQKIFHLFKGSKAANIASTPGQSKSEDFIITEEILRNVSSESHLSQRIKAIKDLCDVVTTTRLEDHAVESLWVKIADLLEPQAPAECRQLVLAFMKATINGQFKHLNMMRAHFFTVIANHSVFEDLPMRLQVFKALSDSGKNLLYFEEDAGPFLLVWMPDIISYGRTSEFLPVLINVIKYNSCYLDDDIVEGLVKHTCLVCRLPQTEVDIDQALSVLDAVVCYRNLPTESLQRFIITLCRLLSVKKYCEASWELMRKMLGTHLGHGGIYKMCCILEDRQNLHDPMLLKGAVFFIGMALWGARRVSSLKHNPTSILPSFKQALYCKNASVDYEVGLTIHRLVKKYGRHLQLVTWDSILEIIAQLFENMQTQTQGNSHQEGTSQNTVQELLTSVEELYEKSMFNGSSTDLFDVIERFSHIRPESSVLLLVGYRAQAIHPTREEWIHNMKHLMEKYFKNEKRTVIRERILKVLSYVLSSTSHLYEEELIEALVLPYLRHIYEDSDTKVRNAAVELLVDVAMDCQIPQCIDILVILEKVVMKPMAGRQVESNFQDEELMDIRTAVLGLLDLFTSKLMKLPSSHAVLAFHILVKHMQSHYTNHYTSKQAGEIRCRQFQCLMQLRADTNFRLGFPNKENVMQFSPYILCDHRYDESLGKASPPSMPTSPASDKNNQITVIPFLEAFKTITLCLKYETDWRVLEQVLSDLTKALQNKTLIIAANGDLDVFCEAVSALINERTHLHNLKNKPTNFTRNDYFNRVFDVITATISYHSLLNIQSKNAIVHCLEMGLKLKCAQQCVDGLTICTLEIQDLMLRVLPGILQRLSTLSATKPMAIPVLEFLYGIIWSPYLYKNFVEEQYMAIFAIALHYTNPRKFSVYVVSLAHHVISMWFIKCRLPFRREFVRFITKGLQANAAASEDRNRFQLRRSSSLNEKEKGHFVLKGSKKENVTEEPVSCPNDDILEELNSLLTETCMDMMARFTFSSCTTQPKRLPVEEFLFSGGQTRSWLVGNKVITITTSGGSSRMARNGGVCEKCYGLFQQHEATQDDDTFSAKMVDTMSGFRLTQLGGELKSESSDILNVSIQSTGDSDASNNQKVDTSLPAATSVDKVNKKTTGSQSESSLMVPSTSSARSRYTLRKSSSDSGHGNANAYTAAFTSPRSVLKYNCTCWCQGWAEIYIRRPTGNVAWTMRIQNRGKLVPFEAELPMRDISTLLLANLKLKSSGWKSSDTSKNEGDEDESLNATTQTDKNVPIPSISETDQPSDDNQPIVKILAPSVTIDPPQLQHEFLDVSFEDKGQEMDFEKPELGVSPIEPVMSKLDDQLNKKPKFTKMELFLNLVQSDIQNISKYNIHDFYPLHKSDSSPAILSEIDNDLDEVNAYMEDEAQLGSLDVEYKQPHSYSNTCMLEELFEKDDDNGGETIEKDSHFSKESMPKLSDSKTDLVDVNKDDGQIGDVTEDGVSKSQQIPTHSDQTVQVNMSQSPTAKLLSQTVKDCGRFTRPVVRETSLQRGIYQHQQSLDDNFAPMRRPRGHTISSGNPQETGLGFNQEADRSKRTGSFVGRESDKQGLNPSFVFLQLYQSAFFGDQQGRPLTLHAGQVVQRAIKVLDRIPPYDAHKIGVVYVGHNQVDNETAILSNVYGSPRYVDFLRRLGTLISLTDVNPNEVYTGGLDHSGSDGKFAYSWQDDVMQVIFHVATLMPNKDSDPNCNGKKLHIGNDYVTVVYNHSEEDFKLGTIKGQFNFVEIIIKPLDNETNLITVQAKQELKEMLGCRGPKMISDRRLPLLVRQMALHANLASLIHQSQIHGSVSKTYTSNWLERLRQIQRTRDKTLKESVGDISPTRHRSITRSNSVMEDFSDYV